MAYADLLDRENIKSQYLAVLSPRIKIIWTWANPTATVYTISFDYGYINKLTKDGAVLTQASSSALSDGDWFYDTSAELLYFDDGTDPNSVGFFVATYELYVGTFDAYFNRDPLDSNSDIVYYEPLIVKSPQILQNLTESLYGFLPTSTSPFLLSTVTQFFQRHMSESSFNETSVKLYHYLDDLSTANVKLVVNGIAGNIKYNDTTMQLTVYDSNQIFDQVFRNAIGESYYAESDFPGLDPNFQAKPIRRVSGIVEGFVPVNIDYNINTPTTSNNRQWAVINGSNGNFPRQVNVASSPASTSTRTYLTSVAGITAGDTLFKQGSGGPSTDESFVVTLVDRVSDYVEHAALTNVGLSGELVERAFCSSVTIVQDGVTYQALYKRDYDTFVDNPTVTTGFTFTSTLESNLAMPRSLSPIDTVFCKVYASIGTELAGGGGIGPIGSTSPISREYANPVNVILGLLDTFLKIDSNALINEQSFIDVEAQVTSELGFAVPQFATADFPKYRDLFAEILQSELLTIAYDDTNKLKLEITGPLGAVDKSIEDDEIIRNSLSFDYSYTDLISDAIVEYAPSEVNNNNQLSAELIYKTERGFSETASYLHGVRKQKTFQTFHIFADDAKDLADRLAFALGDRRGLIKFTTKNRFFNTEIGQRVDISREKIPGTEYERGTNRTISGVVTGTNKSLDKITIELDDQKGIEDNSGSF